MALNGVKGVSTQQTQAQTQPFKFSFQKETAADKLQKLLAEQKKKYDAMTPEQKAEYDKKAEAALMKSIEEAQEANKEKGFFGKIADSFKKDYKDVDSVGDFVKATVNRANRSGATAILGVGLGLLGGAALLKGVKGLSAASKTLAAASVLPAAAVMTSCSDDILNQDIDLTWKDEIPVKPRTITNTVEVPVIKHDTTYIDKPYPVHDTIYVDKPLPGDTVYLPGDTIYEKLPGDTIYVDKPIYLPGDTVYLPGEPIIVKDTVYVPQPADTITIEVPGPVVHDTIYQTITLPPDTITMRPDWHSEVNYYIDDMMDELGVKKEGEGEFTESFVTYDEHNSRVAKYILDPQASARDGSTLRYNRTFINWDDEAGTITPGKNEEHGKVDVSISETGDGLHILDQGQGVQTMDLNREGNLYMVQNKSGESTSPYEPTPLLQEGGFLSRGDFENSIKWNWQTGAMGHFTNAVRKKTDAPIKGE